MIPRASIISWSATAPWPSEDQVEQDLIVSRLLVEIAADPQLSETLAFGAAPEAGGCEDALKA